ncbi:MAG TPA: TNT domain-containing protein [Propionibacteriaceae bacterium]|nr:TNT domain-containing protein [Propionibacteriaceae bacterium]
MPDHIDPSAIPGDNLRPDMVEIAGSEISSIGDEVTDQGGVVVTTWQRLAQHYEAPEAGTLFGVMDPVKTNAETFGNNVDRVSSALKTYAAEVEPIKAELARIKAEAYSFVASIAGGVEKTTFSRAGAITSTVEWHEDQDSVDANNDLIRRVNAQMVLLWAAERKCANAIYDIIGFPHIEAATEDNPNGYGVTEIPDGAETPWGKTVERSESCGEKAVGAVGRFVWDGVVVGGIWGTVVGLGTLTLGYNPQTGEWFDGDTYAAAWSNLGKLAVGLAVTSLPGTLMIANMPGPVGNFLRDSQMTVLNAGKGLLAWDKWKDDPAAAAGEATFNVASLIIPAGAATAPVRTSASTAAAAIRTAARVMDVIDPASALIKVGTAGARIAIPAIADLVKSVDLSKIDIGNLGPGAKIDIPDLPQVEAPKIEVPSVARGDMTLDTPGTGNTSDVPVRTVDTAATIPVREPALVGSGGTSTHIGDGGHIGGSGSTPGGSGITPGGGGALPDAPTGGGGDSIASGGGTDGPSDGGSNGPTGGSDHGTGKEWDPNQGDPVLSDADHGPGFTRPNPDDIRGNPIDPNYGQPKADHGRLGDQYLPPRIGDLPQDIGRLVTDPQAPFGRDAAGNPYSREEFEARYVNEENRLRYPGNEGAVVGRRLDFTSVEEFQAHYGDVLDRLGAEDGRYMSLPETSFEARALPPGSLNDPLLTMRLTGELPPNTVIEVSEVAPAFGRKGGGLQIRILDSNGQAMRVTELRQQGIIEVIDNTSWPADWPRPGGGTTPHYRDWSSRPSE